MRPRKFKELLYLTVLIEIKLWFVRAKKENKQNKTKNTTKEKWKANKIYTL